MQIKYSVDDSIVLGITSRKIIALAREAGAKKVYFGSAAPPVRFPNVYGIDMLPSSAELIAYKRDVTQVCAEIGEDKLFYQTPADLLEAVQRCNPDIAEFDASCFNCEYVTGNISSDYLAEVNARQMMPPNRNVLRRTTNWTCPKAWMSVASGRRRKVIFGKRRRRKKSSRNSKNN